MTTIQRDMQVNASDLLKLHLLLGDIKNGVKKAIVSTINKTLAGVQTDAVKATAAELNLTQARIRKDFTVRKATYGFMNGSVRAKGVPVGLMSFSGTKAVKTGVSVKVKKGGARKILKHAFIGKTRKGVKVEVGPVQMIQNVFWREYSGARKPFDPSFPYGRLPKHKRLPVERLSGPRIEDVYGAPEVLSGVMSKAGDRYAKNLEHEINRILDAHR